MMDRYISDYTPFRTFKHPSIGIPPANLFFLKKIGEMPARKIEFSDFQI